MEAQHTPTSEGRICSVHAGQGDPVLLLHSMGNSSWSYHSVMDALGQNFSVYALDMLGHGDSDKPRQGMSMHDFAQSCVDFMDAHGLAKAHVVGNSVGGTLTLALCQDFPDRVLKSVLVGCPAYTMKEAATRRQEMQARESEQAAAPPPDPSDTQGQIRLKSRAGAPIARDAMYAFDALAALTKIQAPTLVMFGEQDALREREERFRALPKAEFVTIANAGHVTMPDQPEEFARVVVDFLKK